MAEDLTLYELSVSLLQRINAELKENKMLDTINTKMVGVVKDLNDVRLADITGKETQAEK